MRRNKRLTIIRFGIAFAALAIPVTAQAKPLSTEESKAQYQVGQSEIPYLSHGQGVDPSQFGGTVTPDDRSFSRVSETSVQRIEIPYLSHGRGVTEADLGIATRSGPADRTPPWPTGSEPTVVSTSDGWSIDVNPYAATGFALALLLVLGSMSLAIRNRRGRLSPA